MTSFKVSLNSFTDPSPFTPIKNIEKAHHHLCEFFNRQLSLELYDSKFDLTDPFLITLEKVQEIFNDYSKDPKKFFLGSNRLIVDGFKVKIKEGQVILSILSDDFERSAKALNLYHPFITFERGGNKQAQFAGISFTDGLVIKLAFKTNEALMNEKRIYQKISESNIEGVLRAFSINKNSLHAPYCMGKTLKHSFYNGFWLNQAQILRLIKIYADFQEAEIYHFDAKPGNILVDADGSLLVADFDRSCLKSDSIRYDLMLGTPQYCCPTLLVSILKRDQTIFKSHSMKFLSEKKDAFSLGCLLYQGFNQLIKSPTNKYGLYPQDFIDNLLSRKAYDLKDVNRVKFTRWWRASLEISDSSSFNYVFLNLLNPDIEKRWTALHALSYCQNLKFET